MQQILTPGAMSAADRAAAETYAMPPLLLMENAARSVVDEIERAYGSLAGAQVLVVCGKGNNGGDGLAAARHLLMRGAVVTTVLMEPASKMSADAHANLDILKKGCYGALTLVPSFNVARLKKHAFRFIVDAVFGTSFHGAVKGKYLKAIEWMNARSAARIAIDVPSGLDALTGAVETVCVKAECTVTLAALKPGFFIGKGRMHTGRVAVAPISMPPVALQDHTCNLFLVEQEDVRRDMPSRPMTAHKYSIGKILAIAGSRGLTGAALMSSQSALRTGAGAVILCVPRSELAAVTRRSLEVMPFPVASTDEGSFALEAVLDISEKIKWADVVLLGPGIARQKETDILVRGLITSIRKPMVIDAGGITAMTGSPDLLLEREEFPTVITPHLGEFSRLTGIEPQAIEADKIEAARNFAVRYRVVLVLKGAPTIVALPDRSVYINATGNAGMATAGSGDVLAGVIAALMGQGNDAGTAARNGVYLHGLAGDLAAAEKTMHGMIASDIIRHLAGAFRTVAAG
ncbi:MAG TPA: NAD(P)H-hydrate dehydratase [Bacteroidota bacterium]|nr:NAD(P)H-hydrate dehydratase [Bacteroidota bacterium]